MSIRAHFRPILSPAYHSFSTLLGFWKTLPEGGFWKGLQPTFFTFGSRTIKYSHYLSSFTLILDSQSVSWGDLNEKRKALFSRVLKIGTTIKMDDVSRLCKHKPEEALVQEKLARSRAPLLRVLRLSAYQIWCHGGWPQYKGSESANRQPKRLPKSCPDSFLPTLSSSN